MPVMPKRTKYRKMQKGRNRGRATRGNTVNEGEYGIQAIGSGLITSNQIEAARIAMTRYIKRGGKVWIKIFPNKPISKKPAETRMGKGKGSVEYWVAVVKPGRVLFEIAGVSEEIAKEALRLAMHKLPIRTKFVVREGDLSEIQAKYAKYVPVVEAPVSEAAATEETVEEAEKEERVEETVEVENKESDTTETEQGGGNDEDK